MIEFGNIRIEPFVPIDMFDYKLFKNKHTVCGPLVLMHGVGLTKEEFWSAIFSNPEYFTVLGDEI